MAAFNKFDCFVGDLGLEKHNLNTDVIMVYLSNAAPVVTNTVYNTPADLGTAGGYTARGLDTTNTYSVVGSGPGVGTMVCVDVTFTATTGFGPFRYVVMFNETAPADELIGWWDYGSAVTLAALETFKVDFAATTITIT